MNSNTQQVVQVAQATLPSKLETTMEVLMATVAQLTAKLDDRHQLANPSRRREEAYSTPESSRCGGRRFSSSLGRAMVKCYNVKKNTESLRQQMFKY